MSNQPPPHIMNNDLLKRILLSAVHRPVPVVEGTNFSTVPEVVLGSAHSSDALNMVKMLKPTVREDTLLTAATYEQRHYNDAPATVSSVAAFDHDSNMEDYSMDDLSPQGLNGSGDDPMLTIGMDHDSSGTNEHSNSDLIPSSEACFPVTHISRDKALKKKGRPAKGCVASSMHGRFGVHCPVCNKTFNNSSALAKHKLTHSDERKYVCNTCSKTFKRQDHLNGHMLTHSSKKPFECKYKDCGKSYCDARSLKRHLEHHHAVDGSLSSNSQAVVPSYDPSTYNQQTGTQTNPLTGPYAEQFSPVSSTSGSSNGASDKTHRAAAWPTNFSLLDEPLPHKCDLCNRSFKNLPALNGHMRLHGGYFKKDGAAADESVTWSSEATKKRTSNSAAGLAFQDQRTTLAKFSDESVGLTQPETSSTFLSQTVQAQSGRAIYQRSVPLNIDLAESSVSAKVALGLQQEQSLMTSQTGDATRIQELAPHIQLLSVPSSFALNINSVEELIKLQDKRLAYMSSEPVATIMVDPKAKDTLDQNSLAAAGQQLFHIASLPAVSVPNMSLKPDIGAFESFRESVSTVLKSHLLSGQKNRDTDKTYKHKLDSGEEKLLWKSTEAMVKHMLLKQEQDTRLSEHDDTSTDSAKDTDQEDVPVKETRAYRERRRWASADADRFTSGKTKGLHQSPSTSEITDSDHANWHPGLSGSLHRYDREPDSDEAAGDDPPVIDDVRNLQATDGDQMEGEFRNPNVTPALLKFRRKHRPEPLIIPPHSSGFAFHSRLRSPRIVGGNFDTRPPFTPYTPPPMLSPVRNGSGLFCQLSSQSPVSAPVALRMGHTPRRNSRGSIMPSFPPPEVIVEEEEQQVVEEVVEMELEPPILEPPPETDISPHVNVGPDYQAAIPPFNQNRNKAFLQSPNKEVLVWDPSVMLNVKESEVRIFMDFACCAAVPYNGSNKEYAHHVLSICGGNIKKAMLALMRKKARFAPGHTVHSYIYQESDVWNTKEIEAFQDALTKFDKDFFRISQHVGTKSTQKCVQFYYMWKKVATDEHKRLRIIRRKREQENLYNLRSSKADNSQVSEVKEDFKNFSSDGLQLPFSAYVASDSSVGGEPEENIISEADLLFSSFHDVACDLQYEETVETEEYPCKICGKVFSKVKSRSAHMKTHRPMGNCPPVTDRNRQTLSPQQSWQFNPS